MKDYMLSDEKVFYIKDALQNEIDRGLNSSEEEDKLLPMRITYVTERFKETGQDSGNYISVCMHSQQFTVLLVKFKPDSVPEIYKKDYFLDPNIFKLPYMKIYDAFANCVKDFFIEYDLDGDVIPASICTDLSMKQYSLDTAVISKFIPGEECSPNEKDIKVSFEQVLQKDKYQGEAYLNESPKILTSESVTGPTNNDRVYHDVYEVIFLEKKYVKGLKSTLDSCHSFLSNLKLRDLNYDDEDTSKLSLDISNSGIKVFDKAHKNILYYHPIHKISKIVQDFKDSHLFGYVCGDFVNGYEFFVFKSQNKSTEIISVSRDVFATELMRKKKGKLEMQASQVFLILEDFINLSYELKSREIEMPQLLQKRIKMVENINWWLEGCFEEPETVAKEPKELLLNVRLQDLYAAACQIKQLKIQREEAARLEQEKLSGKRRRRKRKGKADKTPEEDYQEEEVPDPLLVKISEIFSENKESLESTLENLKLLLKDITEHLGTLNEELTSESDFTSLNDGRELCFSIFNAWRKENIMLLEKINKMTSFENSERNKIKYKVSSIYTGKKQKLKVMKNVVKNRVFEDIDFTVPKRIEKAKSDLLDKVLVCEEYFLNSLKMRREEVEDLNYFISEFFFRGNISNPEDSKAIEFCRRLFIKAIKMRLDEIDDIEENLKELKSAKSKILFMAADIIEFILRVYKSAVDRRNSDLPVVEIKLSSFPVDIEPSEENIDMIFNILSELKDFIEKDIENVKSDLNEIQEKEISSMEIVNICFVLYNQTLKMRKKEFDTAISELDLFESIDIDSEEDKEFMYNCQEEYITSACMREIEIEGLEFQIKAVDKVFKSQNDFVVNLKDLFDAAIAMEKCECEKIMNSSVNSDSSEKVLPVVYNFKELFEVVVQYLNKKKLSNNSLPQKNPELYISLREFLLAAFELKQKQVEIPVSILKSDLQHILMNLIQEVKKRHRKKQLQAKISNQAMKISQSWKEVFLLAIEMRDKEVEKIVSLKKSEIKEEAAMLDSLKDKNNENADNEASKVVKILKTIFSAAIKMKYSEVKEINQILKNSAGDTKGLTIKSKTENAAAVDDVDEEKYFEPDDANTLTKKESPSEEILNAISSCKHIYSIAINKGSSQLEELKYEMRSIFSDEYKEDKVDVVVEDEVTVAIKNSSNAISDFIESVKEDISTMKINLESLIQVEENIKSQVSNAKSTATHFLTLLLELEENALANTEEKLKKINEAFQCLEAKGSESFRPFTDLKIDVLSEDELTESDSGAKESKDESNLAVDEDQSKKLTKEEIKSVLLDVGAELESDSDEEETLQIQEAIEFVKSFQESLELSSERRRMAINSIYIEIEKLNLPDPKKLKSKEKVKRALKFIVTCKEIFLNSANFRQSELRYMQADLEKMKASQKKEQIVIEFEALDIIRSCRDLFHSAVETRKKNICMMEDETDRLNSKENDLPQDIKNEEKSLMKSEIYEICKDLVLESVDLKMKEVDDIVSYMDVLNNIELKVGSQLKHLDPEKNKSACMKLEKAKDAVATCKNLCSSAIERAKKEVRETDEELELLKRALETSETSLITATCKNLLVSGVERRDAEIAELELQLSALLEDTENLTEKLDELTETKKSSSVEENLKSDEKQNEQISQSDVNIQSEPTEEEPKVSHSDVVDVEQISKQQNSMISDFWTQCKENFLNNIVKMKDEAANLESDLEKLKITVQKVEAEDQNVFSICQNIYAPIIEMRFEEIKSFEAEIKVLQKLKTEITTISSSKKAEDKSEESELSLALASCRRVLSLGIKNRKSEKDTIDFELMKLVRFQDSRIINVSKQFLLTTMQKASEEMGVIKTQLMKIDVVSKENETEMLDITEEVLESLCKITKQQIDVFGKEMQLLSKKKLQMEIEESQFVLVVKKHFLSQVNMRLKEITVLKQELDSLSETPSIEEGFERKILNLKCVHERIYVKAISDRKKEMDDFQFEMIKHYDIKVSDEVSTFERYLQTFIDEVKNGLKMCESETEKIANIGSEEENEKSDVDMIWTTLCRLKKSYGASFKKRSNDCHVIEKMLSLLQGKKLASEEEKKFDVLSPIKQEACFEKLKTDGSLTINACKEILYSVIEVAENEIHNLSIAKEELKRQDKDETVQQKKEVHNFQDEHSEFSEKELALLEALAFDVSIAESTKNLKVAEFCEKFLGKSAHLRETLIQSAKQFLEKLSDIEEDLVFQASKLVYFMTNLIKSFLDEQGKEKKLLQNNIRKLDDIKAKENYKNKLLEISEELQKILVETSAFKEDLLVILKLSLESLKKKDEELRIEVSLANRNCGDLLVRIKELIENNMKQLITDLESLKDFGLPDEDDDDESNLTEDEKAIKKCNLLLLAAIDQRKKLIQSVNLELKCLRGGVREIQTKDSRVFPSWRSRFLTFIGLENEVDETVNVTPSVGNNLMKTEGISYFHSVPDNSDVQALEHFKDLLKSLEEKRRKQPIYIVSSWDDLFLMSFLKDQINKISLEQTGKEYFEDSEDLIKERNWEDLFYEAHNLLQKQLNLSEELKERKQFFVPISTWSEVICQAINKWSSIMEEESENIKNEALLIQWKGNMKSKENLEYSRSSKYGYQSKTFDQLLTHEMKKHVEKSSMDAPGADFPSGIISEPVENVQSCDNEAENGNKSSSTWNYLFSKSIDLLEGSRKALNFMRKKSTKLQSQVINIFSSWDELFSKAIEQRKNDLKDEMKENDAMKSLAKVINEEIQGKVEEHSTKSQDRKFESWIQMIYDTYEVHKSELLCALNAKRSEIEKSSNIDFTTDVSSISHSFLTQNPQNILNQCRTLLTLALEIRKKEITEMEKELKLVKELSENTKANLKEFPRPILIWKLIVSCAVIFKTSGQKFEPLVKMFAFSKHFRQNSENLLSAAMKSKMEELENFESYWKRFTEKQYFLDITPTNISWNEVLGLISELATKDITKMSKFGIKAEVEFDEPKVNENLNEDLNSQVPENVACWSDLVLEALEAENVGDKSFDSSSTDLPTKNVLTSWDEIFFFMNQMQRDAIKQKIFASSNSPVDSSKLQDIRNMVSCKFFTWDILLSGVIEEILWAIQEMSENEGTVNMDKTVHGISFRNDISDFKVEGNTGLKDILKKLGLKSYSELLPDKVGAKKFDMEDILIKSRHGIVNPDKVSEIKELKEEDIWKHLFPFAIEVWHKSMQNYLNFEALDDLDNYGIENSLKAQNSELIARKSGSDSKQLNIDFSILESIERVVAFDYITANEGGVDKKFSHIDKEKEGIKALISSGELSLKVIEDMNDKFKDGEKINPEYFYVSASWYEIFKAALMSHKRFLNEGIDLQENEDAKEQISGSTNKDQATSGKEKLKFHAASVLNQEITLQDLFEIVDVLKSKSLITVKNIESSYDQVLDINNTSGNLDVSNVMDSFIKFFQRSFMSRLHEEKFVKREIEKLSSISLNNSEKYMVYPVIVQLIKHLEVAVKLRNEENELVSLKLDSLKEFKSIFSVYLECPVTESLMKRNQRFADEMIDMSKDLKQLQKSLMEKFQEHLNTLIHKSENYFRRRKANTQLVEMELVNNLLNKVPLENQEMFSHLMEIFNSMSELWKEEIKGLHLQIIDFKTMDKHDQFIENSIHIIISSILNFFENEMLERENLISLFSNEKDLLLKRETELKSKISLMFTNCQAFLLSSIANCEKEISILNEGMMTLSSETNQPNKKTAEILSSCKEYCQKFAEKSESEIGTLKEYISGLKEEEVSGIQAVCLEYYSQASANLKSEQKIIDEHIESFKTLGENVESVIFEAIDEALADIVDLSEGKVFLRMTSEYKESEEDKVDKEVLMKCSEFFDNRKEKVKLGIKALDENAELIKFYKSDTSEIITVLDKFITVLNRVLQDIEKDSNKIKAERKFVENYQSSFNLEMLGYLIDCRKHFEENLRDIEQDIYILKLQLGILSEDQENIFDDISLRASSPFKDVDFDYGMQDLNTSEITSDLSKHTAKSSVSEESIMLDNCHTVLNSAIELRGNFIIIFSTEMKALNDAESRAFQTLTSVTNNISNMIEKRKSEKKRVEAMLLPVETISKTDVLYTCMKCLSSLQQYNVDCLTAIMPDSSRLESTLLSMEKKRTAIFSFCGENLQSTIALRTNEMEFINSELVCMDCMQTSDDSYYVTSTKLILKDGVEARHSEKLLMKNVVKILKSSTEILPVVELCRQHFQTCVRNRKEEVASVEKQLSFLKDEAEMLFLLYAPALETVLQGNKEVLENLSAVVQKLYRISRELNAEEEKIQKGCQTLYSSMLETMKIEREAIKHDLDSLQEVEMEKKDVIDTEGKELEVSFKDLYLTAFNLKKSDLEKIIKKKNIEDNVKTKKIEIIKSLKTTKSKENVEEDQSDPVSNNAVDLDKKSTEESVIDNEDDKQEVFSEFVGYYDIKKERRKLMIEKKIMTEFENIEKSFDPKSQESFDMSKYSEESLEEVPETKTTEPAFNRVYEVKMKEVEERIKYRHEKITGVINNRKQLLDNIVLAKKEELERNISLKENEMRSVINSIKGKQSAVVCSLKDMYSEILDLKRVCSDSLFLENIDEKFIAEKFKAYPVSVKLEKFIDIVLEIKELELQMLLQSKYKDVEKIVNIMKKEVEKLIISSKAKLEEEIKQYRKSEKARAMEYAVSGGNMSKKDEYFINDEKIFPDVNSFKDYAKAFKGFFVPPPKKVIVYEDKTFRSDEVLKNNPTHLPFCRCLPFSNCVPNHILKFLEVEINSLTKIISEMNLDRAKAILDGISFLPEETIHDVSAKKVQKEILLDIVSILNDCTSMLVRGSATNPNCEISLNLENDCNLVYFEKIENVKKWCPLLENVTEVAIDVGLKHFGEDDYLDEISTKFDFAVTTEPMHSSRLGRFISDIGLLEQIKFIFLELHHQHLLGRNCTFDSCEVSFERILKLFNLKNNEYELVELLPLSSGTPSPIDVTIASYVCQIVLMRGALVTAVCLSNIVQRVSKNKITIITSSYFIGESDTYQKMLKIFLSYLSPGKKVDFMFSKKNHCGIGAALMSSVASKTKRENPGLYLLELEQHLNNRRKLFSAQTFMKFVSDSEFSEKAIELAKRYMIEMKFDLPLAVVWAYYFSNGNVKEAEDLYKCYPLSLSKVYPLVYRKISCDKNLDLAKMYVKFLKNISAEQSVKESAYRLLLDVLFEENLYEEARELVQECIDDKIPLTKLRHSTLVVLHNLCDNQSKTKERLPYFPLPKKQEFDDNSYDSTDEENN